MKKVLLMLLCGMLLTGCENSQNTDTANTKKETIGDFEKANYERFNSTASENGLAGTLIYVEGVINEKVTDENVLAMILEQDDGNLWMVSVTDRPDKDGYIVDELIKNKVRVFGEYQGYSSIYDMPALTIASEGKIDLEQDGGDYETVFDFSNYYTERFSSNDEMTNNNTEELFEQIKENCLQNVRESSSESNENLIMALQYLEESFFEVRDIEDYKDTKDNEDFIKFLYAISYLSMYMDEDSVGKAIGDVGWEAVESLLKKDGQFQGKMDEVKNIYEQAGGQIFKNKFNSGQYKVGSDIEPGEYVIFADGTSGYFAVTSDANGDDIIANSNFTYNSIMTVYDGEYLELSRCYAVPIEEVEQISLKDGNMFKVGMHLEPGEYKVVPDNDEGYYCIYGDDRQDDIVANDNFSGQSYVSVSDGQYLELSRCHIEFE